MKVGFLSIGSCKTDMRAAQMALFDSGHSAEAFLTVQPSSIEWGVSQLRAVCDAIAVEGDTAAFYSVYTDLTDSPATFERDGKLFGIAKAVTEDWLYDVFIPLVNSKNKRSRFEVIIYKTFGKSEDELKNILKDYMKRSSKVKIALFPDFLECEVHARCSASIPRTELTDISGKLNELLYKFTYAYDRTSVTECVAQLLKEQKLKIKTAESFTGGSIAKELTSVSGASEYFAEGLVTYSVASKISRLNIPAETIASSGVVSRDTAYNMAVGLIESRNCDIAIATTGNAGPTVGGNGQTGECYISIGDSELVHTYKYTFDGTREENIRSGVKNAMFLLYDYLERRRILLNKERASDRDGE